MNILRKVIGYMYDNAWVCEVMYWGGFIALMACVYSLEAWPYAGALAAGVVMHLSGLIKGVRLAEGALK